MQHEVGLTSLPIEEGHPKPSQNNSKTNLHPAQTSKQSHHWMRANRNQLQLIWELYETKLQLTFLGHLVTSILKE